MTRRWPLIVFAILPGALGVAVFGLYALIDWGALEFAYRHYETIAMAQRNAPAVSAALFVAEADQNIHRVNLFADGVWTLLSALLAALGLHGLYLGSRAEPAP